MNPEGNVNINPLEVLPRKPNLKNAFENIHAFARPEVTDSLESLLSFSSLEQKYKTIAYIVHAVEVLQNCTKKDYVGEMTKDTWSLFQAGKQVLYIAQNISTSLEEFGVAIEVQKILQVRDNEPFYISSKNIKQLSPDHGAVLDQFQHIHGFLFVPTLYTLLCHDHPIDALAILAGELSLARDDTRGHLLNWITNDDRKKRRDAMIVEIILQAIGEDVTYAPDTDNTRLPKLLVTYPHGLLDVKNLLYTITPLSKAGDIGRQFSSSLIRPNDPEMKPYEISLQSLNIPI